MIPISELDLIKIGEIIKAHGYKGELVIKISINFSRIKKTELFFLEIEGNKVPFFFSYIPKPFKKSGVLAKFENIESDKEVKELLKCSVYTTANNILEEEQDVFETIEDYDVFNNDILIGKAGDYLNIPSNPILTVITSAKEGVLIPVNDHFLKKIDQKNRLIIFDLPAGLIEINL